MGLAKSKKSLLIRIAAALGALAIIIFIAANLAVSLKGGKPLADMAAVHPSPVAVVFGAKVYRDGALSGMLADRMDAGIGLYKAGKVSKLLLTGDHGTIGYDEVNSMKRYAAAAGVRDRDIFTDHAGFSTYESLYRARDVFLVKRTILISQKFHLSRALYIANALGLKADGVSADARDYGVYSRQSRLREYFANLKAFWQVNTGARPKFLGPAIPITGDGRRSRA